MKKRSLILLLLVIFVIAGAAAALSGMGGPTAPPVPGYSPAPALPALDTAHGPAGLPDGVSGQIALSADSRHPVVRSFVTEYSRSGSGANTFAGVIDLWEAIRGNWSYERGPGDFIVYHPASATIARGLKGNCLDFAILNAAMVESLGGRARVVTASNPVDGGHAYTEVYAGDSLAGIMPVGDYIASRYNTTAVHWHKTVGPGGETGYWLNLDWQAPYPGGPFFTDNGTYYASFLTGSGERYTDSGIPV